MSWSRSTPTSWLSAPPKARLALQGHQAKVMAREQSGRTVYRVRLGPFDSREGADDLRDKLGAAGVESTLVRVER